MSSATRASVHSRRRWLRPHVFISYAREDGDLAARLSDRLSALRFDVFRDVEKTLIGDRFASVIDRELRSADVVVAIVSPHSAASTWCQAELYQAHALGIPVAALHLGSDPALLPEPLRGLLSSYHYLQAPDVDQAEVVVQRLASDLAAARWRRRRSVALRAAASIVVVAVTMVGWLLTTRTLNEQARVRERAAIIERVRGASRTLPRSTVDSIAVGMREDEPLVQRLRSMAEDQNLPDLQRVNALVLANRLMPPKLPRNRWYIRDIAWSDAELVGPSFSAVTFMNGHIDGVTFKDAHFGGVIWNRSPLNEHAGLMLSGVQFIKSRFDGGEFSGTGGVNVVFSNSHFQGTRVDVEHLAATVFKSEQADPSSPVITDEISVFENAVIRRCVPPAKPGVLEIVPEGSEVTFDGVIFDNVRFVGTIRSSWFRRCHFRQCTFPASIAARQLQAGENVVEDSEWRDEDCGS